MNPLWLLHKGDNIFSLFRSVGTGRDLVSARSEVRIPSKHQFIKLLRYAVEAKNTHKNGVWMEVRVEKDS